MVKAPTTSLKSFSSTTSCSRSRSSMRWPNLGQSHHQPRIMITNWSVGQIFRPRLICWIQLCACKVYPWATKRACVNKPLTWAKAAATRHPSTAWMPPQVVTATTVVSSSRQRTKTRPHPWIHLRCCSLKSNLAWWQIKAAEISCSNSKMLPLRIQ